MSLRRRSKMVAIAALTPLLFGTPSINAAGQTPPLLGPPGAAGTGLVDDSLRGPMVTASEPVSFVRQAAVSELTPATVVPVGPSEPATAPLWHVAADQDVPPFVLIGFAWHGPAEAAAMFRVHTASGWQPWHPVTTDDDDLGGDESSKESASHALPTRSGPTSDPVWVGWADGWELAFGSTVAQPVVHLVRPAGVTGLVPPSGARGPGGSLDPLLVPQAGQFSPAPGPPGLANPPDDTGDLADAALAAGPALDPPGSATPPSAPDGRPPINTRSMWGARPPARETWTALRLHAAIVHHTGSGESSTYTDSDVPAMLRAIQAFHMDARGWDDIGYNFLVDRFGRVWEGRAGGVNKLVVGAQAAGVNTGSFGVAVLGDFSAAPPSPPSLDGLVAIIAWKLVRHGVDPTKQGRLLVRSGDRFAPGTVVTVDRVSAHRDVGLTGCPGDLYRFLPLIRSAVGARMASLTGPGTFTTGATVPAVAGQPVVGDFNGDGRSDIFWYRGGSANDLLWTSRGDGTFATTSYQIGGGFKATALDFDGDGADDIVFSAPGSHLILWGRSRGRMVVEPLNVAGDREPIGVDYDGDGDQDILWYSPVTKQASFWVFTGAGAEPHELGAIGGPYRFAVGDFNGDLRDDVLLYGPGGNPDALWYGAGLTPHAGNFFDRSTIAVDGDYTPLAADLNGDQYDDIVWQAPSGSVPAWWGGIALAGAATNLMAGATYVVGDATGGGNASLYATAAPNQFGVWLADRNGTMWGAQAGNAVVTKALVGDFTGDGQSDVVWWRSGAISALWLAN